MTALYTMDTFHSVMLSHTYISDRQRGKGHRKRCPSKIISPIIRLLDKEHRYCTGKYKRCTAKAEIGTFSAGIPLDVGLAEQIDPHKRNT